MSSWMSQPAECLPALSVTKKGEVLTTYTNLFRVSPLGCAGRGRRGDRQNHRFLEGPLMFVVRRFRRVVTCAAAVAAVAFAVHMVMQPVVAGRSITWSAAAPAATVPPAPGVVAAPSSTSPSASPSPAPGPLDGLRGPFSALLQRLNADTAHNAAGENSILQSLEQALRDYVEKFLNWVIGRH
jgi:negative regulator of sigma E activity